jgi:hypothetical protein
MMMMMMMMMMMDTDWHATMAFYPSIITTERLRRDSCFRCQPWRSAPRCVLQSGADPSGRFASTNCTKTGLEELVLSFQSGAVELQILQFLPPPQVPTRQTAGHSWPGPTTHKLGHARPSWPPEAASALPHTCSRQAPTDSTDISTCTHAPRPNRRARTRACKKTAATRGHATTHCLRWRRVACTSATSERAEALPRRFHSIFRDKNRRDIGRSQSK